MPAYNAEKTLEKTYNEIYQNFVDEIILVDDFSSDETKEVAKRLNITTIVHEKNKGYGGNQKSCYRAALKAGADIVIMLHPDYQYTPKLVPAMASMMAFDEYDAVIASRMLGHSALKGGMPLYKFISNRFLTEFENLVIGEKLIVALKNNNQTLASELNDQWYRNADEMADAFSKINPFYSK